MTSSACWVLDTNIVLDLWVFADAQVQALREELGLPMLDACGAAPGSEAAVGVFRAATASSSRWLATPAMRDELARVLTYPHLVRRHALDAPVAQAVLAAYEAAVTWCEPAPKARFVCTDGDDQKFIDLAVAHRATLVSKDKAVLRMKKRLASQGVEVVRTWPTPPSLRNHRA